MKKLVLLSTLLFSFMAMGSTVDPYILVANNPVSCQDGDPQSSCEISVLHKSSQKNIFYLTKTFKRGKSGDISQVLKSANNFERNFVEVKIDQVPIEQIDSVSVTSYVHKDGKVDLTFKVRKKDSTIERVVLHY